MPTRPSWRPTLRSLLSELSLVCCLNGALRSSLMWLWNINHVEMRGHFWYCLCLWNTASASKQPEFKKQLGMLWAMSENINLSVLEASTHTHTGPKTTCYIPHRLQAGGEEVKAIYGCFRGLTLPVQWGSPSLLLPFFFLSFILSWTESSFPACRV